MLKTDILFDRSFTLQRPLCSTDGCGFQLYLKRKGLTEMSGVLSVEAVCFTLNSISFSALVSKAVTESTPLQVTSRVALSLDFTSIVSPNL